MCFSSARMASLALTPYFLSRVSSLYTCVSNGFDLKIPSRWGSNGFVLPLALDIYVRTELAIEFNQRSSGTHRGEDSPSRGVRILVEVP